jgi:hypothetical protein
MNVYPRFPPEGFGIGTDLVDPERVGWPNAARKRPFDNGLFRERFRVGFFQAP